MNHSIKTMLRLTDKQLEVTEVSYETIQKQQTLVIEATLSPDPSACPSCGSKVVDAEGKTIIVKNGKKKVLVRFESFHHMPTVMRVARQRYTCKNCRSHWTAQSYFVRPNHSIATHVKAKIIDLLSEKVSFSFIAKYCHVSLTTVIRTLKELGAYLPKQAKNLLPKVLMVDEFRSHVSTEDKMSFICADGETGRLIDLLPTRKLSALTAHFQKFPNTSEVDYLVTDMNAAYFQLIKRVFPNAKLVIDRFHIVKHLNQAIQDFRIREMNRLKRNQNQEAYRKLKANWRLLTKNRQLINHTEYKTWRSFRAPKHPYLTEAMVIDRLLDYSEPLKMAYHCFHELADAFREKDHEVFTQLLETLPETLDEEFRKRLHSLLRYKEGIENALIYPYSNGIIEAKNTHIKTLKRVSYGFKSFENMKIRIFLINHLITVK